MWEKLGIVGWKKRLEVYYCEFVHLKFVVINISGKINSYKIFIITTAICDVTIWQRS